MRSVKPGTIHKEYQIEYDIDLGCYWLSGLTQEDFWEELEFIQVFDDPTDKAFERADQLHSFGHHVVVYDITDDEDEYLEDEPYED